MRHCWEAVKQRYQNEEIILDADSHIATDFSVWCHHNIALVSSFSALESVDWAQQPRQPAPYRHTIYCWLPPAIVSGFLLQDGQARPQECFTGVDISISAMCQWCTSHSPYSQSEFCHLRTVVGDVTTRTSLQVVYRHSRFQNGNLRSRIAQVSCRSVQTNPYRKPICSLPFTIEWLVLTSPTTMGHCL